MTVLAWSVAGAFVQVFWSVVECRKLRTALVGRTAGRGVAGAVLRALLEPQRGWSVGCLRRKNCDPLFERRIQSIPRGSAGSRFSVSSGNAIFARRKKRAVVVSFAPQCSNSSNRWLLLATTISLALRLQEEHHDGANERPIAGLTLISGPTRMHGLGAGVSLGHENDEHQLDFHGRSGGRAGGILRRPDDYRQWRECRRQRRLWRWVIGIRR